VVALERREAPDPHRPARPAGPRALSPLWAPWRLEYIEGPKPDGCIFCAAAESGDDAAHHVLARGDHCLAMLNAYPYTSGHLMVAPYAHTGAIEELPDTASGELMRLVQQSVVALREAYGPEGFNIGVNQGKSAGAAFDDHVHMHVVPRWTGDTNFMPVIGDTRVLPQSLEDSFERLSKVFR
jgi:ATP adenylyltransferase